jgi:hypothetical protein
VAAFGAALTLGWGFEGFFDNGGKAGELLVHLFAAVGTIGGFTRTALDQNFLHFTAGKAFIFKYGHILFGGLRAHPTNSLKYQLYPVTNVPSLYVKDRRLCLLGQA